MVLVTHPARLAQAQQHLSVSPATPELQIPQVNVYVALGSLWTVQEPVLAVRLPVSLAVLLHLHVPRATLM